MLKANQDIRERAKDKGVFLWQIAAELGMHDSNYSRLLRKELSPDQKAQVFGIIEKLAREK